MSLPNKIAGLHYISREDAVGVVVVGGRVKMRDGAIRLSNGIELGLKKVTGEGARKGVLVGLSEGAIEIGQRKCESACHW